jgi:hypothetical protein
MEEVITRFEIIRLAIKIGDFRTIDWQCEKLRSLSMDDHLNEITDLLENKNFRQAMYEMKRYAQNPDDSFFNGKQEKSGRKKKEKEIDDPWSQNGLFALEEAEKERVESERILDLDDILRLSESPAESVREYTKAPEYQTEELLKDLGGPEKESPGEPSADIKTDNAEDAYEKEGKVIGESPEGRAEEPDETVLDETRDEKHESGEKPYGTTHVKTVTAGSSSVEKGDIPAVKRYAPISYIGQKFRNMVHQFSPVETEGDMPSEVENMRKKISAEGYTEKEIEKFLDFYQEFKASGKKYEAAMVLLLAAATESKFAQFLLARELFRGEVITQDHAESFTQINTLADQNFAEAICDLGQFYEYGVGIGKDRQMALLLYEEAAGMGIARARKHYERLRNSKKLLGMLKKVPLPFSKKR